MRFIIILDFILTLKKRVKFSLLKEKQNNISPYAKKV